MIPIQDVTKKTGITVLTLRYDNQIGLLNPTGKTPGTSDLFGPGFGLRKNRDAGPASPQVQRIIRRIDEKTEELFAGEAEFLNKL